MLLSAAQIDHWILLYDAKEDDKQGGWDKSSWFQDKEWLQEEFPLINLPFLVDCDPMSDQQAILVLSQTNAVASYLGRDLGLLGNTKQETAQCEELLCELTDLRDLYLDFAYKTDQTTAEMEAKEMLENAKRYFEKLEHHLIKEYPNVYEKSREKDSEVDMTGFSDTHVCHLVDNQCTVPDFFLWEVLNQLEGVCNRFGFPNCLGEATTYSKQMNKRKVYPHLKEFHDNFLNLPANKAYGRQYQLDGVADPHGFQLPYNSPYARFGSCPDPEDIYVRGQETPWRDRGVIERNY
jgi:hypothetical protein